MLHLVLATVISDGFINSGFCNVHDTFESVHYIYFKYSSCTGVCGYRVPEHARKGIGVGVMLHLVILATVIFDGFVVFGI